MWTEDLTTEMLLRRQMELQERRTVQLAPRPVMELLEHQVPRCYWKRPTAELPPERRGQTLGADIRHVLTLRISFSR